VARGDLARGRPADRDLSHLYGFWPPDEITPYDTPDLAAAAHRALELRGAENDSAHTLPAVLLEMLLQSPPTDWSSCPRCRPLSRRAVSRAYARGSAPRSN
jgi:hypothetical protein